jgi:hypothetical protein
MFGKLKRWLGIPEPCSRVLLEVAAERERQDAKWGVQDLPFFTSGGPSIRGRSIYLIGSERAARQMFELREGQGVLSMGDVLLEEVAEVFELRHLDPERAGAGEVDAMLRAELLQVAAVAVKAIEALDRRANS